MIVTASNKQRVLEPLDPAGGNPFDDRSVHGNAGSVLTIDPRGDEVLYSFKRIPLAEWDALVYLPTSEAFFPIRDLQQRLRLAEVLQHMVLTVSRTRPLAEAIVTSGGIATREINPKTMES